MVSPHALSAVAPDEGNFLSTLQRQTVLGLAEDVAKEGPVALSGTAGYVGRKQPGGHCRHAGELAAVSPEPAAAASAGGAALLPEPPMLGCESLSCCSSSAILLFIKHFN